MRDEYDGTRVPTRYSRTGTLVLTLFLAAVLVFAISVAEIVQKGRGFESCEQARRVGVTLPLTPADPGWNPALDTDHNGQAC